MTAAAVDAYERWLEREWEDLLEWLLERFPGDPEAIRRAVERGLERRGAADGSAN